MGVDIGTVREQELTTNKDGDDNVRLLQVELSNPDDLQTVEQIRQSGDDSNPQPGSRVIVLDLGASYRVAIAVDDGVEPSVDPGEKELYSYNASGVKQATLKLTVGGKVEIMANSDFAVRYSALETAYNQLKSDFDDFVANVYNLHSHASAPVGPVSPPSLTGLASTGDITGAKIDEILVP